MTGGGGRLSISSSPEKRPELEKKKGEEGLSIPYGDGLEDQKNNTAY